MVWACGQERGQWRMRMRISSGRESRRSSEATSTRCRAGSSLTASCGTPARILWEASTPAWGRCGDYLSRAFQLSRGTVDIELQDVLANDRREVALSRSRAERKRRHLDTFDAVIFRVEGGKFTEVWHRSEDPYASDVFWS